MSRIEAAIAEFRRLDRYGSGDSVVHRLDARAKIVAVLAFIVAVASFDRYQVSALLPFALFPIVVSARAGVPFGLILRRSLAVLPFALMVGLFNPLFDRAPMVALGPVVLSAGWVSFASIVLRALLTTSAALLLVAVTGFPDLCRGLGRLGVPRPFTTQLLFLYRYIVVLAEDAARASRARELRTVGDRGLGIRPYASMVGHLLLRTWARAERVHLAMLSRGFAGDFPGRPGRSFGAAEGVFAASWIVLFALLRLADLPQRLGSLVVGGIR